MWGGCVGQQGGVRGLGRHDRAPAPGFAQATPRGRLVGGLLRKAPRSQHRLTCGYWARAPLRRAKPSDGPENNGFHDYVSVTARVNRVLSRLVPNRRWLVSNGNLLVPNRNSAATSPL